MAFIGFLLAFAIFSTSVLATFNLVNTNKFAGPKETGQHVVADGYVYIGGAHTSYDLPDTTRNKTYQLDADDLSLVNTYTMSHWTFDEPTVYHENVFIGDGNGVIYKLDGDDLSLIDLFDGKEGRTLTGPILNGYIYVTADNELYKIDTTDMSLEANFTVGETFTEGPSESDGKIYVGDWGGKVYQLDSDLNLLNTYDTGDRTSGVMIAYGYAYVGGGNDKIYQFDVEDLSLENTFSTGGAVFMGSPSAANGYVYFGDSEGNVYQFDKNLNLLNSYSTGGWSSISIGGDYVYVDSSGGDPEYLTQLNATNLNYVDSLSLTDTWAKAEDVVNPVIAYHYVYGIHEGKAYQVDIETAFGADWSQFHRTNDNKAYMFKEVTVLDKVTGYISMAPFLGFLVSTQLLYFICFLITLGVGVAGGYYINTEAGLFFMILSLVIWLVLGWVPIWIDIVAIILLVAVFTRL